jgi:biotin transporter BioY
MISTVISVYSKRPLSHILMATASCLYGYIYAYPVGCEMLGGIPDMPRLEVVPIAGIFLIPIFVPLWLIAIVIERRHRKKHATPPPPASSVI